METLAQPLPAGPRIARGLLGLAQVHDNPATRWLLAPQASLGGTNPIELLITDRIDDFEAAVARLQRESA